MDLGTLFQPIEQAEPLTVRLRNLLRGYPKGFGIIKEFVQNADDAGASAVEIVMDWRTHPAIRLPSPEFARLAGPALLVANDAVFTDGDFTGILALGESGKRLNSAKIGKFGLGFNAAYNVTDHPCVVSRDRLFVLDPQRSAVASVSAQGGTAARLAPLWSESRDLLLPFLAGGLNEGETDHSATIFRLPLRGAESAETGQISNEPFTPGDFRAILAQTVSHAPELLLFLRNVLSLRVSEIPAEGGAPRELLHVRTENPDEVAAKRAVMGEWLGLPQAELLRSLRDFQHHERVARYEHHLRLETPETREEVRWYVVNGFHPGPGGELLDLAEAILGEGELALPLAGAAARLGAGERGGACARAVQGKVFCGLPLPRRIGLGIHLHAFFDLDDSRDWLKANTESVGTREQHRLRWNQELIRHGLAAAAVTLLDDLAARLPRDRVGDLYALWPDAGALSAHLPGFAEAVYDTAWAGDHPVIRVHAPEPGRVRPRDVVLLPDDWHQRLSTPLAQAGLAIPAPPLPPHMVKGFEAAARPLPLLTPEQLRDRWRTEKDVGTELESAPNPAWRRRDWVIDLLDFVLSDGAGDLKGVPLALLADGTLHTFGHSLTFLASESQRALYALRPRWFLDPEVVERCRVPQDAEAKLLRMTPAHVLLNLKQFLKVEQDGVPWEPRGETPPNAPWLASLFRYLHEEKALADASSLAMFRTLALIPDQFGRLNRPGLTSTPLWPVPEKEGRPSLRKVLGALRVPLVKAPAGVSRALRSAVSHADETVVWGVTGPDLVDAIFETVEEWDEKARVYRPDIHDVLLDFLASHDASGYSEDQIDRLRELPVFPTLSKELVALSDVDATLPSDTRFPAVSVPGMLLLKPGGTRSWRGLLKRLGVGTLNHLALAERILELDFGSIRRERRTRLLTWLRTNLDRVLTDAAQNREPLLQRIRTAKLVQGDDGGVHAASALYDRDARIARDVLGPLAIYPDFAGTYSEEADRWQAFFQRLGSPTAPQPEHLLAYLDGLIAQAAAAGPDAVADRLLALFDFVRDHWKAFESRTVLDPASRTEVAFPRALAGRAWLSARRTPERLQTFAGYVVPENRLYRPGELYEGYQGHLVASRAPIAPFSQNLSREVREGLGIPAAPPLDLVIGHLEHLLELWDRDDRGGLDPRKLTTSLHVIYRDLGNRLGSAEVSAGNSRAEGGMNREGIVARLRERFAVRACLWDETRQRFWLPAHAFAEPVPFFGTARATLVYSEAPINAAYEILGRRAAVGAADLTAFLAERAAANAGEALPEPERANVLLVLRRLAEESRLSGTAPEPCPLLSEEGRLLPPSMLFEDDDPYHRRFLDEGGVHLVDPRVPESLCRALGVRSLDGSLEERMAEEPRATDDEALALACSRIASTLHSGEFTAGLRRLLRHARAEREDLDLAWLRRLEVVPTLPFDIELWLPGEEARQVGAMEGSFFFQPGTARVYVAADSVDFLCDDLAHAIDRRLGGTIGNLSPLVRMLESEPGRIETLLTRLKITRTRGDSPPEEWHETWTDEASPMTFAPDADEDTELEASLGAGADRFIGPECGDGGSEETVEIAVMESWAEAAAPADAEDWAEATEVAAEPVRPRTEPYASGDQGRDDPADGAVGQTVHDTLDKRTEAKTPPFRPRVRVGRSSAPAAGARLGHAGFEPPAPRPRPDPAQTDSAPAGHEPAPPPRRAPGGIAPGAFRRRPSANPGSGSWKSRVLTYLQPRTRPTRDPEDANNDDLPQNRHIGEAAEAFAHEEEQKTTGRVATRMPHNNPGFDILSESADGGDRRFIEVKGIKGEWSGAGVPLSARQFEMAWEKREAFWVYVVEHALDPERRRITRIRNPVGFLTEYRLDHHWRHLGV